MAPRHNLRMASFLWPLAALRVTTAHLAFEGLGAEYASGAFDHNAASLAVSRTLGYVDDGIDRQLIRGRPALLRRLRLDRAGWLAGRRIPVEIEGLAGCLPSFGLPG